MAEIHFHIERPGPRSRYIIPHMLRAMAGWDAQEVTDLPLFRSLPGPKLFYGRSPVAGCFHVEANGLLEGRGHHLPAPGTRSVDNLPMLFPTDAGDLPFDVFAAAFFALSRMEEYGPIDRDVHGRPASTALHAALHGYLHRPVVDEWLYFLAARWRAADAGVPAMRRTYAHTATLDVDNGAMYLGRPWWRTLGAAARDVLRGHPSRVRDRAAVLLGTRPDPYAVHADFIQLAHAHGAGAVLNFLMADRGRHDHAIRPEHAFMRALITHASAHAEVGLHPGYGASDQPGQIIREKQRLEALSGAAVTRSRQHFLRLRLPETLRELERAGIREEHSMGLADRIGFRAGTCTPFPFYDLLAEEQTALMVHPFAIMDSAMAYRMRLSPEAAVQEAQRMVDAVRKVEGRFISVWHERFLSGYGNEAGWGSLAKALIPYARP